jgi:hypothetical protein
MTWPLPQEMGFDQDQIAKLHDVCGVCNAQQVPSIWAVIQGKKGKSFDTYCTHLARSVKLWCHSHHIDKDKLICLNLKFFEDLAALQFNLGGPWHSTRQPRRECQCSHADLSLQLRQSNVRTTRKRQPIPPTCNGLMISSKGTLEDGGLSKSVHGAEA